MKPKAEKKKGSRFSAEVAALEKNDPDFFNYLKNEEADILEFSDGDDDDVDVDDVDSDEDEEELDDEENLDDEEDDESGERVYEFLLLGVGERILSDN